MRWLRILLIMTLAAWILAGCITPQIKLFPDSRDPLQEFVLQGSGSEKILLINIRGFISDAPEKGVIRPAPSLVEEVVAQLEKAKADRTIKALLVKVNSPGGTVTASDILYHELSDFKKKTGAKMVVAMMDMATSGGYYVSLPADHILAHPTTITGSVGVIFMHPSVQGLMEKIGLGVQVSKSGANKDMGSPFRKLQPEEQAIFQELIRDLAERFLRLVKTRRDLDDQTLKAVASARIYTAAQARQLGLVDELGYLSDAIKRAKSVAGLSDDARVVVYRRSRFSDDNLYNTATTGRGGAGLSISLAPAHLRALKAGPYYLWAPGLSQ